MRFNLGLIVAKTDNGIPCLGTSNLGPQINYSTKKIVKQTQRVLS